MECVLKNITVNYEEFGEGRPVILIHGFSPDHRLMTGCMEPIFSGRQGFRRIYIDLPGMGKTKGEPWIDNSDKMLRVVLDFIDKIIPGQNFLLAGQSYGGYLARGVLYNRAENVDGLFLLCPLIIAEPSGRNLPQNTVSFKDEELLAGLDKQASERFQTRVVNQNRHVWERYYNEVYKAVKISDTEFLERLKAKGYAFSFNVDEMKTRFEKPTLFILGRQDLSVGYKDAWEILDNYPRATFAVLDKAGHELQLEQEKLFNCLVNEWLDRVLDET